MKRVWERGALVEHWKLFFWDACLSQHLHNLGIVPSQFLQER